MFFQGEKCGPGWTDLTQNECWFLFMGTAQALKMNEGMHVQNMGPNKLSDGNSH